jgi:hypothetical protein
VSRRTNKSQPPTPFHNLFAQVLIAQLNDTPSLAKAFANLESHKLQETLDVEYSSFLKNNSW